MGNSEERHPNNVDETGEHDRRRLERVCRYLLRPPFARDAIEALEDDVSAGRWRPRAFLEFTG
jgi:hypothetical protein